MSDVSNVKHNLLDTVQNGICNFSMNCKKLPHDEFNGNDKLGNSEGASNDITLPGDLQNSSNGSRDVLDHSRDSLRLIHGVDTSYGESFHQHNSLQPCSFYFCSKDKSVGDIYFDLAPESRTCESSDFTKSIHSNITVTTDKNHLCDFNSVTGCMDSFENDREVMAPNEQHLTSPKESFELVKAEVFHDLDNEKLIYAISTDLRSMERCSDAEVNPNANILFDANECESTPSELNGLDGSVGSEFAESTDREVKENRQNYHKPDEHNKAANEITTMELESMLGDLVCDQLIESGAMMLRHYYSSEGVLSNCPESSRRCNEDLNSYEAKMEKEERYNADTSLASSKDDLTVPNKIIPTTERNLDESQDILYEKLGLDRPDQIFYGTGSDMQNSEPKLCSTNDELSQPEEELNGSHTISSEPENISLKSRQNLFESREALQASAYSINEHKVLLNKSDGKPMIKESQLDVKVKVDTENATSIDFDDGVSNGTKNLIRDEKGGTGKVYERPDHKTLVTGKNHCHCMRSGEISSKYLRKLGTQSAKYRRPMHEHNLDSRFGCARPLNAKKGISPFVDHEVMENCRQSRLYATWYNIYRQQLAWMKYHSWQYRKSTAYIDMMWYNY